MCIFQSLSYVMLPRGAGVPRHRQVLVEDAERCLCSPGVVPLDMISRHRLRLLMAVPRVEEGDITLQYFGENLPDPVDDSLAAQSFFSCSYNEAFPVQAEAESGEGLDAPPPPKKLSVKRVVRMPVQRAEEARLGAGHG